MTGDTVAIAFVASIEPGMTPKKERRWEEATTTGFEGSSEKQFTELKKGKMRGKDWIPNRAGNDILLFGPVCELEAVNALEVVGIIRDQCQIMGEGGCGYDEIEIVEAASLFFKLGFEHPVGFR